MCPCSHGRHAIAPSGSALLRPSTHRWARARICSTRPELIMMKACCSLPAGIAGSGTLIWNRPEAMGMTIIEMDIGLDYHVETIRTCVLAKAGNVPFSRDLHKNAVFDAREAARFRLPLTAGTMSIPLWLGIGIQVFRQNCRAAQRVSKRPLMFNSDVHMRSGSEWRSQFRMCRERLLLQILRFRRKSCTIRLPEFAGQNRRLRAADSVCWK